MRIYFNKGTCPVGVNQYVRCLHTGQNQPLAFLFLRVAAVGAGWTVGIGAGAEFTPGAPAAASPPSCAPSAGVSPTTADAGSSFASGAFASLCTICPPAPNSIMLIAHSRHATRWRQGKSTTSRGAERQRRHSEEGSSSYAGAGVLAGGYVVGGGAVGGAVALEVEFERPYISCKWKV